MILLIFTFVIDANFKKNKLGRRKEIALAAVDPTRLKI